ncbi:MAG: hypothetical protein AAFX01_14375 [Cyanobacteria bacterium J06638_28]
MSIYNGHNSRAQQFRNMSKDELDNYLTELSYDCDKSLRSLEAAERRLKIWHLFYIGSLATIYFNTRFSYEAFLTYSDSQDLAIGVAILTCLVQVAVNAAIFSGNLGKILKFDLNGNGTKEWYEHIGSVLMCACIASVYLLDIGTNLLGVNQTGLQEMGVALGQIFLTMVPGFVMPILGPVVLWLSSLFSLAISVLLCLGDEILTIIADVLISLTKRSIPELRKAQGIYERRLEKAKGYYEAVIKGAHEQGVQEGASAAGTW